MALLIGLAAGLLPLDLALLAGGCVALLVISLIDLRAALILTLTLAPLKALIETESRIALPLDIGQIALLLTLGLWALRMVVERRTLPAGESLRLRWSPALLPVLAFTFAAALSLWSAWSPGVTINELIKWLEVLLVMALVISISKTGSAQRAGGVAWVAAAVLVGAVVQAMIGIYEFGGGSGAPHLWILDFRFFRAFGSFGQPNPFGAFMGLTLPLALGLAVGALDTALRRARARDGAGLRQAIWAALPWIVCSAALAAGLFVSWSRGAWLGFGAAGLVMLLFLPRRRWLGIGMVVLCVTGLSLSIITGVLPDALVARFSEFAQDLAGFEDARGQPISDANYAVLERLAHWQAALGMAGDHPWLGVGFGNYEVAYPRYALVNWPNALGHAHNYYLNLLAEVGMIGLAAYVSMWLLILSMTLRLLRRLDRPDGLMRGAALGLAGVWVQLAVHSAFDKLYVNNLFLQVGAMLGLMGVLWATALPKSDG